MVSKQLVELIEKISKQGKMSFLEKATQEQIESFEKQNDVQLPQKLKEWLKLSDGGEFFLPAGVQMYGVAHKPIINVDDTDRPNDSYIVIGALASGDPILCEKSGEKIAIYNHQVNTIDDDEVYDDFFSFLDDLYDLLGIGG